jgi:hypothetical protein
MAPTVATVDVVEAATVVSVGARREDAVVDDNFGWCSGAGDGFGQGALVSA